MKQIPCALIIVALLTSAASLAQIPPADARQKPAAAADVDWEKARQLFQRERAGEKLTADEQTYLNRAKERRRGSAPAGPAAQRKAPDHLPPLCDMTATDRYEGEDGGLYGSGANTPPEAHAQAARAQLARIAPLGADGKPSAEGRIVLVSISMSNATQEFSFFKRVADASPQKSPRLTIVDCAQGGQAMAEWAPREARPWAEAKRRLSAAGVSPQQVQVAWVKLANKAPRGSLQEHGRKLEADTLALLHNARAHFPNLRIAYLGSRTYGGYAEGALNPEPYAFESALPARWLIQRQIKGDPEFAEAKAPLLLWGPYLWADGARGRKLDGLVWERSDFAGDGVHPSESGRAKVAKLLLDFFINDPLAKPWFVNQPGG
ncbi:MAG: hypothetical protein M3463_13780 [Verrucomicrobiota bacterium]|nr:hypothetical protein [Verrucomicrobiota bacterium]